MIQAAHQSEGLALHLTLDAPKANVLSAKMIAALESALDAEIKPSTRLVVFEGAGKHFSFGASVEEHQAAQAPAMLEAFHGLFRKLAALAVPTCAVVRGQCLGGGLELASWCTWIVASPDARLGQPEIQLAVFPPMASLLLPWRVGGGAALDLCLSGRTVDADEALHMGLISAVAEDPTAWWHRLVERRLAKMSAAALRFGEQAARMGLMSDMDTLLPQLERLYLDELMQTHDANEGIAAFLEGRPAQYLDR